MPRNLENAPALVLTQLRHYLKQVLFCVVNLLDLLYTVFFFFFYKNELLQKIKLKQKKYNSALTIILCIGKMVSINYNDNDSHEKVTTIKNKRRIGIYFSNKAKVLLFQVYRYMLENLFIIYYIIYLLLFIIIIIFILFIYLFIIYYLLLHYLLYLFTVLFIIH